jgi:hypothetical protein
VAINRIHHVVFSKLKKRARYNGISLLKKRKCRLKLSISNYTKLPAVFTAI